MKGYIVTTIKWQQVLKILRKNKANVTCSMIGDTLRFSCQSKNEFNRIKNILSYKQIKNENRNQNKRI